MRALSSRLPGSQHRSKSISCLLASPRCQQGLGTCCRASLLKKGGKQKAKGTRISDHSNMGENAAGLGFKSHKEQGAKGDAGGCSVLCAQHRSSVPIYTESSNVKSLVIPGPWVKSHHSQSSSCSRSWCGANRPNSSTGHFPSPFQHHVSLIPETCCYIQALTWAYKNVWKAFIRTTPALQRCTLLTMFYEESE